MTTIKQALDLYLAHRANSDLGQATLKSLRSNLGATVDLLGPNRHLEALTTQDLHALVHDKETGWPALGLSPATRTLRYGQLRVWLTWCDRHHLGVASPFPLDDVPAPGKEARHAYTYLTEDDLWRGIDSATNPRDRALIVLASFTALRIGEVLDRRLGDLSLEHATLNVVRHKTHTTDEIPLPPVLVTELEDWLTYYHSHAAVDSQSYLVPRMTRPQLCGYGATDINDRQLQPDLPINDPRAIIARALKAVGIADTTKEGWHTLRRSAARIVFESFCEIESGDKALLKTMIFLGHTKVETTIRYIGLDPTKHELHGQIQRGEVFGALHNKTPLRAVA